MSSNVRNALPTTTQPHRLFVASCIALVATAMSFAIRGDIMGDFERLFALSKTDVGWIAGAAFWGFGFSILVGGPLCDLLGMGALLRLAAAGHIAGVIATILAPNFTVLFAATLVIGIANGLVEAAINPLVATIYSHDKTRRLVALHAWFPGGIVIGGVLSFLFTQIGHSVPALASYTGWQAKMLLMLVPSLIYGWLFAIARFPATERASAGVPFGDMFKEIGRPMFLVVWSCMWLTAATELGPGQWVSNIFNDLMSRAAHAGILVLVWVNGIMYVMRQFLGGVAHRVSPVALIASTAIAAAAGLFMFGAATTPLTAFAAAALFAAGTAFWWPTMLGITSERFPRGGALTLAIVGATGAISTAIAGPVMGWINDTYGADRVLSIWAILPVGVALIFSSMYLRDRMRGGYQIEELRQQAPAAMPGPPARRPRWGDVPGPPARQPRGGGVPSGLQRAISESARRGSGSGDSAKK
jgi:fucose permease